MKTVAMNLSRTVAMNGADLLQKVDLYGAQAVGKTEVDGDGSATLTKLERRGNVIDFAFEFDQGSKARGKGAGTLTVTALGQTTSRLDCRGSLDLEGAASKLPGFALNKLLNKEIDKLLTEMIAELKNSGPQAPDGGLAA